MKSCPCGSKQSYADCCQPFIEDKQIPQTPEQLMRSRYTAYTLGNIGYISKTMKGRAAEDFDINATRQWATQSEWKGLKILNTKIKPSNPDEGTVEFIARYRMNDKDCELQEISLFQRQHGRWYYVDGEEFAAPITPIRRETPKSAATTLAPVGVGKNIRNVVMSSSDNLFYLVGWAKQLALS